MRKRQVAWILILIVDVACVAWGAMAAAFPDHLLGPGGTPILTAGYEGFSKGSWSELARTTPMTARYMDVLFRMYGVYNVAFWLMAIAITVTAFRRGEAWAWWTLLAWQHARIGIGDGVRQDRECHRAVRADGIPWPRPHLGSARRHRSIPCCGAANSIDGLTRFARQYP